MKEMIDWVNKKETAENAVILQAKTACKAHDYETDLLGRCRSCYFLGRSSSMTFCNNDEARAIRRLRDLTKNHPGSPLIEEAEKEYQDACNKSPPARGNFAGIKEGQYRPINTDTNTEQEQEQQQP